MLGWWLFKGGLQALLHSKAGEYEGIKGNCLVQKRKGKNGRGVELGGGEGGGGDQRRRARSLPSYVSKGSRKEKHKLGKT